MRLHRPEDARAELNISPNRLRKICLYAIGGNALSNPLSPNDENDVMDAVLNDVFEIIEAGYSVVLTHGNGPQVGELLLMEESHGEQPEGLDHWVAATQGTLGHDIATRLDGLLTSRKRHEQVATLLTRVAVDPEDSAFAMPTKPIGPIITGDVPEHWTVGKTSNGLRRLVPSPRPLEILDSDAIESLVNAGAIVLSCGGGGIPVLVDETGFHGVEAVIDKDLVSSLLAQTLSVDLFIISTAVDSIKINFGTPTETPLRLVAAADLKAHLAAGQFPMGSMGPKVESLISAKCSHPSMEVILCMPGQALAAVRGEAGTTVEN
jgi:carbamate kinase